MFICIAVLQVNVNVLLEPRFIDSRVQLQEEAFLNKSFTQLKQSGVNGITVEVWWGLVEQQPQMYNFIGYLRMLTLAREHNLKVSLVIAMYSYKSKKVDIPIPKWATMAAKGMYLFKD